MEITYQAKIEDFYECDVLVAGGGPAGIAAAIASAREGAATMLIEKYMDLSEERQPHRLSARL